MDQKIMDCFANPIKCKLLLEIYASGQTTAKRLSELYSDIPQATLYRYLKRMTDEGILKIVGENPIRGTVEKTYALAVPLGEGIEDIVSSNSGEAFMLLFMNYMLGLVKQFQEYCKRSDIDIMKDHPAFTMAPVYATNEELEAAVGEFARIIEPLHHNPPAPGRKLRTIGLIVTPPETYNE